MTIASRPFSAEPPQLPERLTRCVVEEWLGEAEVAAVRSLSRASGLRDTERSVQLAAQHRYLRARRMWLAEHVNETTEGSLTDG